MTRVTRKEGFRYGAYIFGYWLALLLFSGVLIAVGGSLIYVQITGQWALGQTEGQALAVFGGFVAVLGVLVVGAGQFGLLYKLVSDAVGAGVRNSRRSTSVGTSATSTAPASGAADAMSGSDSAAGSASSSEPTPPSPSTDRSGAADAATDTVESADSAGAGAGSRSGDDPGVESDPGAESDTAPTPPRRDTTGPTHATGVDDGSSSQSGHAGGERDSEPADGESRSSRGGASPRTEASDSESGASVDATDATDATDAPDGESPEEVASESEIAEELGFNRAEGDERRRPVGADRDASDADDLSAPQRSEAAEDPLDADSWETGEEKRTDDPETSPPDTETEADGEAERE